MRLRVGRARLTAIAALAAASTAAAGLAAASQAGDAAPAPESAVRGIVTAVQPEQASAIAILARDRTAADAIPESVRPLIGDSVISGRNMELSRAISTPNGKGWVIPGNEHVCLAVPDPVDGFGITCDPTELVAQHGAVNVMVGVDGTAVTTLLLPKGATATVGDRDGNERSLAPNKDRVVSSVVRGASNITIQTQSGRKALRLADPSEVSAP